MTIIHAEHERISWVERGGIYKANLLTSHELHMGQICASEISAGALNSMGLTKLAFS